MKSQKLKVISLLLISFTISCAYFNTLYNAQKYFEEAEDEILKAEDPTKIKKQTMDALKSTIKKCQIVLDKYPESRFCDDALLLMGKAQYYRGDYILARETLNKLIREYESPLKNEANIWLFRCKWKLGKSESAFQGLKQTLPGIKNKNLKSLGYAVMAEIFLETGESDSAILYLEKAALNINNRTERSRHYYQIAELAFSKSLYQTSTKFYRKVIRESTNPTHIEQAHLQIVKTLRLQGKLDKTAVEIQNLLTSEKFVSIHPELNLELAKLYEDQDQLSQAMNRYSTITQDFPNTKTSAEAYFHLGRLTLETSDDYEGAKKFYDKVAKEKRNSIFAPSAKIKIKEINALLEVKKEIQELEQTIIEMRSNPDQTVMNGQSRTVTDSVDSFNSDTLTNIELDTSQFSYDSLKVLEEFGDKLYSYAELLAFHFNRPDSGLKIFERLIDEVPSSPRRAQAMFSAAYLCFEKCDSLSAQRYYDNLISEYPYSEYAEKVLMESGKIFQDPALDLFIQAEKELTRNVSTALELYQSIIENYPSSRFIPQALLASAYIYDRHLHDLEKSIKKYEMLIKKYPNSDQAITALDRYNKLLKIQTLLMTEITADSLVTDSTRVNED